MVGCYGNISWFCGLDPGSVSKSAMITCALFFDPGDTFFRELFTGSCIEPSSNGSSKSIGQLHTGHFWRFSAFSSKQWLWNTWSFSQSTTISPKSNSFPQMLQLLFFLWLLVFFEMIGMLMKLMIPDPYGLSLNFWLSWRARSVSCRLIGGSFRIGFDVVMIWSTLLLRCNGLNLCSANISKLLTTGTSASISIGLLSIT